MAKRVEFDIVGIDVAKDSLEIFHATTGESISISNEAKAIDAFLGTLDDEVRIALEPTGRYHEMLLVAALDRGLQVYLIDPFRLSQYRKAIGQRAKTDASDAKLLARYFDREGSDLHPAKPRTADETRLWRLLGKRAAVVKARTSLKQSLAELSPAVAGIKPMFTHMDRAIAALDRAISSLVQRLGWRGQQRWLEEIPGVGKTTSAALLAALRRHPFRNADAFVAYLGLDVRVTESGRFSGKRKLTKRGRPELRRLLFLAGRSARRTSLTFRTYFERLVERGMSKTAADVAVGRKLARTAFAMHRDGRNYVPAEG